jgi:hypothetical protein
MPESLDRLVQDAGRLYEEATRCAAAGCWRAALVLIGSALEAGIVATACQLEPRLQEQGLWPSSGEPSRWTLGQAIGLAVSAGWLPARRPDGDLFGALDGDVGDAVEFLNRLRAMAVHPVATTRSDIVPDFGDVEHMRPTFEVFEGIMAAVFERLRDVVDERPDADPDLALLAGPARTALCAHITRLVSANGIAWRTDEREWRVSEGDIGERWIRTTPLLREVDYWVALHETVHILFQLETALSDGISTNFSSELRVWQITRAVALITPSSAAWHAMEGTLLARNEAPPAGVAESMHELAPPPDSTFVFKPEPEP